jgi:hypothetical protein
MHTQTVHFPLSVNNGYIGDKSQNLMETGFIIKNQGAILIVPFLLFLYFYIFINIKKIPFLKTNHI